MIPTMQCGYESTQSISLLAKGWKSDHCLSCINVRYMSTICFEITNTLNPTLKKYDFPAVHRLQPNQPFLKYCYEMAKFTSFAYDALQIQKASVDCESSIQRWNLFSCAIVQPKVDLGLFPAFFCLDMAIAFSYPRWNITRNSVQRGDSESNLSFVMWPVWILINRMK